MQDTPSFWASLSQFIEAFAPYWWPILTSGIGPAMIISWANRHQDRWRFLKPIAKPTSRPWIILLIFAFGFGYASFSAFKDLYSRFAQAQRVAREAQDHGSVEQQKEIDLLRSQLQNTQKTLEAIRTVRHLSMSSEIVKDTLSYLSPMRVDILTFGDTKEIADFGRDLSQTLEMAGWKPKLWSVFQGASYGVTGAQILTRKEGPSTANAAASVLERALMGQQIFAENLQNSPFEGTTMPVSGINGPPWDEKDVADVRVYIGAKP